MHLFRGCAVCWAPLALSVPLSPQSCQLSWGAGVVCAVPKSFPLLLPALPRSQGGKVAVWKAGMCFGVGASPRVLPASSLPGTETKRSSLRYFIWLFSNKYHSPNSKFLLRTIYGQFTAWRINAITELKYFWIKKLKKSWSAFRQTALKKDVAFLTRPLLANSFKGRKQNQCQHCPQGSATGSARSAGSIRSPEPTQEH